MIRRRVLPHAGWLAASLLIFLAVAAPAAYFAIPHLHRSRMIKGLTDHDQAARDRSLNYVIRMAPRDDRVVRSAANQLTEADDRSFVQLKGALDVAGEWDRDTVGDASWLRSIELLAENPIPGSRVEAAHVLADVPDLADDDRVTALMRNLIEDEDPDVRYNTMTVAAELAGAAEDRDFYLAMIRSRANDPEPVISRHAWIFMGHLGIGSDTDWRKAPPEVAQAIVWATHQVGGDASVLLAVNDRDAGTTPRSVAAYAGVPLGNVPRDYAYELILSELDADRLNPSFATDQAPIRDLACVLAAQKFSKQQNTSLIRSLLTSYDDRAKMSGAILSGLTGFRPGGIAGGLSLLLETRPELSRQEVLAMSNQQLAGLGLRRIGDLLANRAEAEDVWPVQQVQRLGLWMQGADDGLADPAGMLNRDDMPTTTVLLAMLHRTGGSRTEALDYLFNPRGEPALDLVALLFDHQWWHVLKKFLPDGAPSISLDADEGRRVFQVDVLRDWYLVNRIRLAR